MQARRYNKGKLKWSLVSWKALAPLVEVLMYGAHKYSVWTDKTGREITGADITPEQAKEGVSNGSFKMKATGANNWRTGLPVTEVYESLQRHLCSFIEGEDNDDESKLSHLGHAFCNLMFISWILLFKPEFDDRYVQDKEEE